MKNTKILLFTLVTLVLFFLLLEGAARLFFPSFQSIKGDRINILDVNESLVGKDKLGRLFQGCMLSGNTLVKDNEGLIRNRPGMNGVMLRTGKMNYVYDQDLDAEQIAKITEPFEKTFFRINQNSMRGEQLVADERPRLLFLGDSITFGYYVNDEEAFPARLAKIIRENNRSYQILNSGVSSYSAQDEWRYLKKYGQSLRPTAVGIGFYLNDIFSLGRPLMVSEYSFFFPYRKIPVLWRLGKRSRLINLVYERLLTLPYFNSLSLDADRPENVSIEYAWQGYAEILSDISEYCRDNKIKLFMVVFPNAFQLDKSFTAVNYQNRLLEITSRMAIPSLDLLPVFEDDGRELYQKGDTIHPNAIGHAVAAEAIAAFLEENNLL